MEFSYDGSVDPPAPVVELAVSAFDGSVSLTARVLIDSGADISVLPETLVRALDLRRVGFAEVAGYGAEAVTRFVYSAQVRLPGSSADRLVRVLSWDSPEGLAGRDLLNHWRVVLDGPRRQLTVEEVDR